MASLQKWNLYQSQSHTTEQLWSINAFKHSDTGYYRSAKTYYYFPLCDRKYHPVGTGYRIIHKLQLSKKIDIFQLYVHSPTSETIGRVCLSLSDISWSVNKCAESHNCKYSYLLQPDLTVAEAEKVFSFTSNAVQKRSVYIRVRINPNGHDNNPNQ